MQKSSDLVAGDQITGERDYQEDAFQVTEFRKGDSSELLIVLADGMGGHVGGARASHLAVATFVEHFEKADNNTRQRLRESLDAANAAIAEDVARDPRYGEMGCTLLACMITGDELYWLSVGDSPLWFLHGSKMTRLNADHSMRPVLVDLVELGRMSASEFEEDSRVNQLRSALTGEDISMIDQNESAFNLANGDRIILASDGLETLPMDEIGGVCDEHGDPTGTVAALLEAIEARQRKGQDNATAVVYKHNNTGLTAPSMKQADAVVAAAAPGQTEPETGSQIKESIADPLSETGDAQHWLVSLKNKFLKRLPGKKK